MTPEQEMADRLTAMEAQIASLKTTVQEYGDALKEANTVRDELNKLKAATQKLAEALILLPASYQQSVHGKSGVILQAAEHIAAALKS